jgi:hypothetical protein
MVLNFAPFGTDNDFNLPSGTIEPELGSNETLSLRT